MQRIRANPVPRSLKLTSDSHKFTFILCNGFALCIFFLYFGQLHSFVRSLARSLVLEFVRFLFHSPTRKQTVSINTTTTTSTKHSVMPTARVKLTLLLITNDRQRTTNAQHMKKKTQLTIGQEVRLV